MNFLAFLILQVKLALVLLVGVFEDRIYAKYNKLNLPQKPGRVAVVTGGARGMGTEVIKMLLQSDMEVVMACRNTTNGEKTVRSIREESGIKSGKVRVMHLDNASFDSIKKFVTEFQNNYEKLDVLVNNAGVLLPPYKETKDGFEEQYGVNYLSHFLLTLLLIPQLKNAGTPEHRARVINVSSIAHLLGDIKFQDTNRKQNFLSGEAYAQSKLALILSAKKFARIFNEANLPISAHAAHPGIVDTEIFKNSVLKYLNFIANYFISKEEGTRPIIYAAVSPEIEGQSGLYISHCRDWPVKPIASDESVQNKFFELSLKQVGMKNFVL